MNWETWIRMTPEWRGAWVGAEGLWLCHRKMASLWDIPRWETVLILEAADEKLPGAIRMTRGWRRYFVGPEGEGWVLVDGSVVDCWEAHFPGTESLWVRLRTKAEVVVPPRRT